MRWLVDVTPLGNGNGTETVQVDADTWQNALVTVRTRRGEAVSLSGFSIELLEGGECRAIDPSSHVRYDVRSDVRAAPEREAVSPVAEPSEDGSAPPRVAPRISSGLPPRPSAHTRAVPRPASTAASAVAELVGPLSGATEISGAPAAAPPTAAGSPLPADRDGPPLDAPAAPAVAAPRDDDPGQLAVIAASSAPTAAFQAGDSAGSALSPGGSASHPPDPVPSQIIFKREQDRTPEQPITYREYVYMVPHGTSDGAAEELLRGQLNLVRTALAQTPAGKLIHLAAFDVQFQGKPPVAPIATLTWKDWLGTAVVALPRRAGPDRNANAHSVPRPEAVSAKPLEQASAVPEAPSRSEGLGAAATREISNGLGALSSGALPRGAHDDEPEHPRPAPAVEPAFEARARARGEDLIADLFEAMHELHFLRDAVEGGAFCLALCADKIPCNAGVVHLYDIDRREYLVTNTRGTVARQLLLKRTSEADPVLAAAMRRRHAIAVTYTDESEARGIDRYDAIGGVRRVLVAPVMQAGRYLGALELIDPLDGQPFTETETNAMTYIAGQFADFVAARGVVTDPERISSSTR